MQNKWKDLLSFSAGERLGIIVLIILILLMMALHLYLAIHEPSAETSEAEAIRRELELFGQQLTGGGKPGDGFKVALDETLPEPPLLFDFDPNTASETDLIRLGMDRKVARTLLNYREKGGRFRSRDDLRKIYGMSAALYARLAPYVNIASDSAGMVLLTPATGGPLILDMNMADTIQWQDLPGIGSKLADRIVRYRSLLGGFSRVSQLREVYGISDSLYNMLEAKLFADSSRVTRISVNEADESMLAAHPYIGSYYARAIISYRRQVTRIGSLQELLENGLLPASAFEKARFYLSL